MKNFSLIAAVDSRGGIGYRGGLPWHLPDDLRFFKKTTLSGGGLNAVIMGRNTWMSIPKKFRPLAGRLNIVLTRHPDRMEVAEGLKVVGSFAAALQWAEQTGVQKIFIIGGAQVYAEAIELPSCQELFLTEIQHHFDCDAFFPDYSKNFQPVDVSPEFYTALFSYRFVRWARKSSGGTLL